MGAAFIAALGADNAGTTGVHGAGTGGEDREVRKVATVERKLADGHRVHRRADRRRGGLNVRRSRIDFNSLGQLTDLEAEVEGLLGADGQRDLFLDKSLEALGSHPHLIATWQ